MLDFARTESAAPTGLQRSHGAVNVAFDAEEAMPGQARLRRLAQSGSAKAILPGGHLGAGRPEVVFLNTSGGLTSGDRFECRIELGAGLRASATTQTAERAYAALEGPARVSVTAEVAAGGRLDWLPQETILFEHAHLVRDTRIALTGASALLMCETVVLGRLAMGEAPRRARLFDRREVTRDGMPFWIEAQALDARVMADAAGPALLGDARALAVIALIDQGAEDAAPVVRDLAVEPGVRMSVSGWNGRCLVRLLARDNWPLRQQVLRVLTMLGAVPLPRVWQL